jgi:hypothetical protein
VQELVHNNYKKHVWVCIQDVLARRTKITTQRDYRSRTLTRQSFSSITYRCGMVSSAGKHTCHHCNQSFSRHWLLERHMKEVCEYSDGSMAPSFECSLCKTSFKRKDGLRRHEESAEHKGKATRTGTTYTAAGGTDHNKIVDPLESKGGTRDLPIGAGVETKKPRTLSNTIASASGPDPKGNHPWDFQGRRHSLQPAASHQSKSVFAKLDTGPYEIIQSSQELPEPVLAETDTRDGALVALPIRPSRGSVSDQTTDSLNLHLDEMLSETSVC